MEFNSSSSVSSNTKSTYSTPIKNEKMDFDENPLWRHVKKLEKSYQKGGNTKFQCSFCNNTYAGSYSRVRAHLLKLKGFGIATCAKVTSTTLTELQRLQEIANERNKPKGSLPSSTPNHMPCQSMSLGFGGVGSMPIEVHESAKKKRIKDPYLLEETSNMEMIESLHEEIARMFYSGGLPFRLVENPHFISSFAILAGNNIPGFVPPDYNSLGTTLLKKERARIERLLQPIKGTWGDNGVSIVMNGWSDSRRRPLINMMAVTESGSMFLKAVNCEGQYKDHIFIANLIKAIIIEVGPQNVVQIITDNDSACEAAGRLIEAEYPHIFWNPCVVHTLYLAMNDICAAKCSENSDLIYEECLWISEVAKNAAMIRNFILNHSMKMTIYNDFAPLKLLSIVETRFVSEIGILRRLQYLRHSLISMVSCENWPVYAEDNALSAQSVKGMILDDIWWHKIEYITSFTAPIYDMLRAANTEKPSLHLMYGMWDAMVENVKSIIYGHEGTDGADKSSLYFAVHAILMNWRNKSISPLHCLAHSLNPRYYSQEWLNEGPNRIPPHQDVRIYEMRNKCLKRYVNDDERVSMFEELSKFMGTSRIFCSIDTWLDRDLLDAKSWWLVHGAVTPKLQRIALKLLGQPCSASCCDQNWTTFSCIHSISRKKVQSQQDEDLLFVHNNLRLLSRKTEEYMKGETKMWDVGADTSDFLEDTTEQEIANLSLNEAEMEALFLRDDNALALVCQS